jgi:hypothetical protein
VDVANEPPKIGLIKVGCEQRPMLEPGDGRAEVRIAIEFLKGGVWNAVEQLDERREGPCRRACHPMIEQ